MDTHLVNGKQIRFPLEAMQTRPALVKVECCICGSEFAMYQSRVKGLKKVTCSKFCYTKRFGNGKPNGVCFMCGKPSYHKFGKNLPQKFCSKKCAIKKNNIDKALKKPGFYKKHKEEYADKIINYSTSPTGKAYIGIAKKPLMKVKEGFGFQGLILQDDSRELIQCHACGDWKQKIADKHLEKCCGLTTEEYKKKYGLNKAPGLVSDETSLRLTKNALMNKNIKRASKQIKKYAGINHNKGKKHTTEFFNKKGTCPLQLRERLYDFVRCNRELPSQHNRGRPIYKALISRYGSWGHALQSHGLPFFKRTGTNMLYIFKDGSKYKYNINQFYDREALFKIMMEKCPVLQK